MCLHDHDLLIDTLGGTVAAARACEVSPQAVSQWRRSGIPKSRLMYLRLLRPDAFAPAVPATNQAAGLARKHLPPDLIAADLIAAEAPAPTQAALNAS